MQKKPEIYRNVAIITLSFITDLTWCYKIVFGYVDIDIGDSISFSPAVHTRGHG